MTAWIMDGIPGIETEIMEFIIKNERSSRLIQTIWIQKPIKILAGVFFEKATLPPWRTVATDYS